MEPQINADERRFVDPDLKNFLDFSSETIVILKNLIYKTHLFNTSSSAMKKINNELGRTQNELMPSEFVPVRFSSLFFSGSFMNHNSWPTLRCFAKSTAKDAKTSVKCLERSFDKNNNLSAFICVHPRLNFYLDPSSLNLLQYCDLMGGKT